MVVDQFFFVLSDSSIQFVYQAINRGVHIFLDLFRVNRTTIYVYRGFGFVLQFFDCENTVDI